MRKLQESEISCISGGDDLSLAATAVVAPMALSVSSGVTGGSVTGVGLGGVVAAPGLVPVVACISVGAGSAYLGYAAGDDLEEKFGLGQAVGNWMGNTGWGRGYIW